MWGIATPFDRIKRVKANATGLVTLTLLKRWSHSSQANRRVREPPKMVIMSADCVRSPGNINVNSNVRGWPSTRCFLLMSHFE